MAASFPGWESWPTHPGNIPWPSGQYTALSGYRRPRYPGWYVRLAGAIWFSWPMGRPSRKTAVLSIVVVGQRWIWTRIPVGMVVFSGLSGDDMMLLCFAWSSMDAHMDIGMNIDMTGNRSAECPVALPLLPQEV